MLNKISKVQTENLYEVSYDGSNYTVVSVESLDQGYMDWDVFDDSGSNLEEVDQKRTDEIIAFVIQNT